MAEIQLNGDEQLAEAHSSRIVNWLAVVEAQKLQRLLAQPAIIDAMRDLSGKEALGVFTAVQEAVNVLNALQRAKQLPVSGLDDDSQSELAEFSLIDESVESVPSADTSSDVLQESVSTPEPAINNQAVEKLEAIEAESLKDSWLRTTTVEQLDQIEDIESARGEIKQGFDTLMASGIYTNLDLSDRQRVLDRLRIHGATAETISDRYIGDLIETYVVHAKAKMSAKIVNSICFWGYLRGVDEADMIPIRSITRLNPKKMDVNNSRRAVEYGVVSAWRAAGKWETTDGEEEARQLEAIIDKHGWDRTSQVHSDTPEVPAQDSPDIATQQPIQPQAVAPLQHERSITEEPPHVQLAYGFHRLLKLENRHKLALEALLNPKNRNDDMTPSKLEAMARLRKEVRTRFGDLRVGDLKTKVLSESEHALLVRLIGWGGPKEYLDDKVAMPMSELVNIGSRSGGSSDAVVRTVYKGLEKLFNAIVADNKTKAAVVLKPDEESSDLEGNK